MVRTISGGKRLDANVEQQILAQAGGNPFFLEELTRAVVEQGAGTTTVVVPDTIQAVLAARLDRLSPDTKHLLQTAAVIGKDVPVPLLHALVGLPEEALHHHLSHLQAGELLYQTHLTPVPIYTFRHILTWEVAYGSLLPLPLQQLHGQIAQVLARQFPDLVSTQPELLAHHYAEAGLSAQAVVYWQRAGQRALERSAYVEASLHLTRGLEVLEALPVTPENIRHELRVRVAFGQALVATKGHGSPDVEQAYARALTLGEQVGDTVHLLPVLWGLWRCYSTRAELQRARQLGEKMLVLAERQEDRTLLVMAHLALGMTVFFLGELTATHVHLEHGIALYDPEQHHALSRYSVVNPGVMCRFYAAFVLWELGYPDRALQRGHEGLALATELSQPFSLAYALYNR